MGKSASPQGNLQYSPNPSLENIGKSAPQMSADKPMNKMKGEGGPKMQPLRHKADLPGNNRNKRSISMFDIDSLIEDMYGSNGKFKPAQEEPEKKTKRFEG